MPNTQSPGPPKPDVITQAELAAVLATYNELRDRILDLRRRLNSEMPVEPGIYTADDNPGDPISGYEHALTSIGLFGLEIETKGLPSQSYTLPASEKPEPKLPEWVTFMALADYRLIAWDSDERAIEILLTSEEFLTLRDQLAELRGITVSEEATTNAN